MFYNGVEKIGVRGMNGRVQRQHEMVTYMLYNGVEKMGVRGMNARVQLQQKMVT